MRTEADSSGLPALLTQEEVADWLGVSSRTLRRWRAQGVGPPATTALHTIRYPVDGVLAWLLDGPAEMARAPHLHTVGRDDPSCAPQLVPAARDGLSHHRNAPAMGENSTSRSLVTVGGSR